MTLSTGRPDNRSGRWSSKRFWLGILLAGAAGWAVIGQMDLVADDETEAIEEAALARPAAASGALLSVAYKPLTEAEAIQAARIERARDLIADAADAFTSVKDYTCLFVKRERIGGKMGSPHIMEMKVRNEPAGLYFKFRQPNKGREAIYLAGKNDGKILAHDVGLGKLLGGTMWLDPKGMIAMASNRHPITEAGLAELIETVSERWGVELSPEVSDITIDDEATIEGHKCTMVDSTHPVRRPEFFFYKVRLYFDRETSLPIRFEAYDWPKNEGGAIELLEEYTYSDLKINVGLGDIDFDTKNPAYSFGRF